jgi:hypothetical protein
MALGCAGPAGVRWPRPQPVLAYTVIGQYEPSQISLSRQNTFLFLEAQAPIHIYSFLSVRVT